MYQAVTISWKLWTQLPWLQPEERILFKTSMGPSALYALMCHNPKLAGRVEARHFAWELPPWGVRLQLGRASSPQNIIIHDLEKVVCSSAAEFLVGRKNSPRLQMAICKEHRTSTNTPQVYRLYYGTVGAILQSELCRSVSCIGVV